jgi:hypothetical protein
MFAASAAALHAALAGLQHFIVQHLVVRAFAGKGPAAKRNDQIFERQA